MVRGRRGERHVVVLARLCASSNARARDMDTMIPRRTFVRVIAGGFLGSPLCAVAQPAGPVHRIGFLFFASPETAPHVYGAFVDSLRELGYVEGRNIAIEARFADGRAERLLAFAADLVDLKVDVIMAGAAFAYFPEPPGIAARRLTKTIPIVMFHADPVGSGLVTSLARPGGNVTGLSLFNPEIVGKQLALLQEVAPRVGPVAILRNATNSAHALSLNELGVAARSLGVELQAFQAQGPDELETAFSAIARGPAKAVLVLGDSMFFVHRARIAEAAKRRRLPTMAVQREHAEAGALMSYGANLSDIYRRAGGYVAKILKGAKPADLPVEQPTKFDLVINLRTASALGLSLPPRVLLQADEVLQ
jgi:putative ABC transport system substrate-binding protein